jgi:hypothetical protein
MFPVLFFKDSTIGKKIPLLYGGREKAIYL